MSNYCSQKFWWLSVEPERRQVQSCCAAYPHKIDLAWVKNNPGQLFNTPLLQQERKDMLNDIPVASCDGTCWAAERAGKSSRRLVMQSDVQTHTNVISSPEVLSINIGSDCNLTCVYCSKQFSTAWLRDVFHNGPYLDEPRYDINSNDRILLSLGQKKIYETESYNLIINEIAKYTDTKEVTIHGGEPFLNNNLVDLVKNFKQQIRIFTGLGVNTDRLERILADLPANVEFAVSAENIGSNYEFIRHNNSFETFERNLALLRANRKVRFASVLSNLTIFNFANFEKYYPDIEIEAAFCNEPDYLSINVLDDASKDVVQSTVFKNYDAAIKETVRLGYTKKQHSDLVIFLKEFVKRRNLDINIFPESFLNWLNTPQ